MCMYSYIYINARKKRGCMDVGAHLKGSVVSLATSGFSGRLVLIANVVTLGQQKKTIRLGEYFFAFGKYILYIYK